MYPDPNPMRHDPRVAVKDSYTLNFVTSYKLKQTVGGVEDLDMVTSSSIESPTSSVRVLSDRDMCMENRQGSNNIYMSMCKDGDENQGE